MSLAGRVENPKPQPIPIRSGGFGGVDGFRDYLKREKITHVVDATHPFAAQMSHNAVEACDLASVPLIALARAPWVAQEGDNWTNAADVMDASAKLAQPARRVLLAIGRMHLRAFAINPQHFYLLRLVDAPTFDLPFSNCKTIVDRGPFGLDNDVALLRDNGIDLVVSKNSGGTGARAKIDAARQLGIEVMMIHRPDMPARNEVHSADGVMDWLANHPADLGV